MTAIFRIEGCVQTEDCVSLVEGGTKIIWNCKVAMRNLVWLRL